jgi:hypothetical protein
MRNRRLSTLVMLAIGSFGACGEAPEGPADKGAADKSPADETLVDKMDALTTGFTLHNYQTGYCLGVAAGTPTINNKFVVWRCDKSANQNFQIRQTSSSPSGYFELMNMVAEDRCMDSSGPVLDICWDYDFNADVPNDDWHLTPVLNSNGATCYNIDSKLWPGYVMGVAGKSTAMGATVIMWPNWKDPVGHPDQLWCAYAP